ncbi:hypothetical protein [Domibacillus tundrae]|uniref:hypothetical protein n=1 Tax=Domibacillus tundrae TaxID=1587527 RepID=UPI000617FF04|nr:hypothetical protein [Domibacillus tundrae]
MIKHYNELSDEQQKNLCLFLDKAQNQELYKIKTAFDIKSGRNLIETRQNVLHGLMMDLVDFKYFVNWLNHVYLEGYNTLFVYETDDKNSFSEKTKKRILQVCSKLKTNVFDLNKDSLKEIHLTDVVEYDDQILITLAAPAFVIKQKNFGEVPDIVRDIYLAYVLVDFNSEQFVLSLNPITNLYSVCGVKRKKELDTISTKFIDYFRKNVLPFNFSDPDWVIDALFDITEEYYDHNNPMVHKKLEVFKSTCLDEIVDLIGKTEESFKAEPSSLRIKKSLIDLLEIQLISRYGTMPKETNFKVFLHEAGKGITSFKADSRGKALSFADSYEIVKKMIENAEVASLGITYLSNHKEYPYKVVKEANYYSLKRITTASTEKEIVDNVLRQLKQYKPRKEFPNPSEQAQDN